MRRRAFTLLELTVTLCLLGILSLAAFAVFDDRAADVAESSGRARLEVAVAAQDAHLASFGRFADADGLTDIGQSSPVDGIASTGEISVDLDPSGMEVAMATPSGKLCVTVVLTDDSTLPYYSTFEVDGVQCQGSLGMVTP